MSKSITLADAVARFQSLETSGLTIGEAIQEAVDRIFEIGRYSGTTEEIELEEADFTEGATDGQWYLFFDESDYDGAIGFRCEHRGWSIVDQVVLYKDGINAGDLDFVDLGTIDDAGVEKRKYRCPRGWDPASGPYYVLMKKEAPVLADDDIIPIQGFGALKCAVQAVCYEHVGDEDRSTKKWGEFDQFMKMAQRQTNGPKKFFIGMTSSLKRKPSQFM